MKPAVVRIRTPKSAPIIFAGKLEDGDGIVKISGDFDIAFDGKTLSVSHGKDPKYLFTFSDGFAGSTDIHTDYGVAKVGYSVKRIMFRKSESGYVWKIAYKLEGDPDYGIYTVEVRIDNT